MQQGSFNYAWTVDAFLYQMTYSNVFFLNATGVGSGNSLRPEMISEKFLIVSGTASSSDLTPNATASTTSAAPSMNATTGPGQATTSLLPTGLASGAKVGLGVGVGLGVPVVVLLCALLWLTTRRLGTISAAAKHVQGAEGFFSRKELYAGSENQRAELPGQCDRVEMIGDTYTRAKT